MTSASDVIEWWDEVVRDSKKGQTAKLTNGGIVTAAHNLALLSPTKHSLQDRARAMIGEDFRDEAYLNLIALERSWEALGEKVRIRERKRGLNRQPVGNPPTDMKKIREIFESPRLKPEDLGPIRKWLEP